MGNRKARKFLAMATSFTLLAGSFYLPTNQRASAAAAEGADFYSSFEASDPIVTWENKVESDIDGNALTSGIDGNTPFAGIPGSITNKVVEVTARGEYTSSGEVAVNLIDSNTNSKWLDTSSTSWVRFKLSEASAVMRYALTSANDSAGRDPKNWQFEGSNDGSTWTTLDTRTNQTFSERFQTKVYDFANETPYLYYRLNITANSGDSYIQLSEFQLSNGIVLPPPPPADMKSYVSNGPSGLYNAKSNAGWTGLKGFTYSGTHLVDGRAYSYNKVYNADIAVTPNTELSYYIAPEFTDKAQMDYSSTYAAVDLAFSDGTYLHNLGALDQHGVKLNPQDQGNSKTLYNNQWNFKKSNIGAVAAGKTIKRILVAYDNPAAKTGTGFKGTIDDIKIVGNPAPVSYSRLSDYANILRGTQSNGTFSRGNNIPAVAVPHGFNFWIPKTNASSDWAYYYNQSNNANNLPTIQAFALSHEPSPWMGDRQTFHVMPSDTVGTPNISRTTRELPFKHENEIAKPYYYGVTFENGLKTEFTPTDHAAMFRFTFAGDSSNLLFDNQSNSGGITLDAANNAISGYSDQKSGLSTGATRIFIYATFDKPVTASGKLTGSGGGGTNVQAYYKFDTTTNKVVTMKIATSLISLDQAKKNLELEISPADTFETIKEKAQTQWDQQMGIIQVEGASEDQLITLYSNMYRLFLYPNSAFENVGTNEAPVYKHADQTPITSCSTSTATTSCAKINDGKIYVNNGFWDTYRTAWPAYSLLTPSKAGEFIDGFVQHYRDGGWISRWSSPGYANLMVGTSANVAFADAYLKGVANFDVQSFYQSALKDAAVTPPNANVGRKGMATSVFDGYTNTDTGEGLAWAVDGYINDFGIANLADALSKKNDTNDAYNAHYKDDQQYYINRAQNYVNMFNPNLGFFNGRTASGAWRSSTANFDPRNWGNDYTETNAWNMAFHAPQDGQGLANLYGGRAKLAEKLDSFFSIPEPASSSNAGSYGGVIHEMTEARDVRMGQYGHSNQPSHHIIYMYDYAGQPWKTQEKVREALDRLYLGSQIGQGYAGDEDNGEMSAWYIFGALGFYPLKMGSPEYAVGAPLFKKATIQLENGKKLVVNAPNNSKENKYVQSLKVNGEAYTQTSLPHAVLAAGATLDFDMGPTPSTWGSGDNDVPSSITQGSAVPAPLKDMTDKLVAQGFAKVTDSTNSSTIGNLFDNSSNTRVTLNSAKPWVQYQFLGSKKQAAMYTLTSGNTDGDAKSWMLKGSNDGQNWTVLDQRTNETFAWRSYTRPFTIQTPGKYEFYRLEVSENSGTATTSFAEIELLGYPTPPVNDETAVAETVKSLDLGNTSAVTKKLTLPTGNFEFGTTITWVSSNPAVVSNEGKIIKRPDFGQQDVSLTLIATVNKGSVSATKVITITVLALNETDLSYEAGVDFKTGLEAGDVMPTWENRTIESKNIGEFCCGIGGVETKVGTPGRNNSTSAILYSGNATSAVENYAYNQMFDADFDIKPSTVLSYWINPEGSAGTVLPGNVRTTSQNYAVDLLFTDGTYLHNLSAVDQNGVGLNPLAQGNGGKLVSDQWNFVTSNIGAVAAGKRVDKILISFNATGKTGYSRGYFDDISIEHGKSEATAFLSGSSVVSAGQTFNLTYGLGGVTQSVYGQDFTITYNSDIFELLSAKSAKDKDFVIVDEKKAPGQSRYLAVHVGPSASQPNGALLSLQFKAKTSELGAAGTIAVSQLVIADGEGKETEMSGVSKTISIKAVDKTALNSLITEAQAVHDAAVEGTKYGQYPVGSKAILQAAIDTAKTVAANLQAVQDEVDLARTQLNAALQTFKNVINSTVDKATLNALIAEAQSTHDAAVEGTKTGEYPAGAKALLQAAVNAASQIASDAAATQSQVDQAVTELNSALQGFLASVNTRVPEDMNGDDKFTIGDLAIVAAYYGKTDQDANWNLYKKADLSGDGQIDVADLAMIASKILNQ
ncbi:GH92 family glycosyl hydrolase [Paenibacillus chondroitinus]|uniref:GH92 family glycosyl hydrolase n=1 Tax=Paenibacillus chondroitinus TaxID=59842 RepID=A0ABU6DDX2_9BACL|nr:MULTISPECIES: GH92 family glycosyl hydrolase [Paenibacillus]MCY9657301.1 GH92 family glycosyl hydrolase [Paenibacillus anseongense]MEB4795960.1 GH92 family glycosyl hydrolase [Paenibacillus chondroitinus]